MSAGDLMIIQTIIQGVGILSLIVLVYQIWNANKWNRLNNSINQNWNERLERFLCSANENLLRLKINKEKPLIPEEVNLIRNDSDAETSIRRFLFHLEEYACAYIHGVIDPEYAYDMHSSSILFYYKIYIEFIKAEREVKDDIYLFSGLASLYDEWADRLENEKKHVAKKYAKNRNLV